MKIEEEKKLFRDISIEEVKKILTCSKSREVTYQREEYLFRQGDMPRVLYLVLEGTVLLMKDFPSGRRDVLYPVTVGDVFGEMFLLSENKNYIYDAVAQTKVTCLEIPWHFFYGFCQNACTHHQLITRNMMEIQSEKNLLLTKKLHLLSGTSLRERIILWIFDHEKEPGRVTLSMKREEFADYLGTTRPSLSRALMQMKADGLILLENNEIIIANRRKMEEMISL